MCMEDLCSYDTTTHTNTSSPRYIHSNQFNLQGAAVLAADEEEQGHEETCDMLPDCMTKDLPTQYISNSASDSDRTHRYADSTWMIKPSNRVVSTEDWGIPGFLTEDEFQVFKKFRAIVDRMGGDFRMTVFSFEAAHEEEEFALCRWLRANKFNLDDTIRQVEEAVDLSSEARRHLFYPDPAKDALGVHPSIYIDHYPQFNHGRAKNGSPIFVSKPGALNFPALACITTPEGIIRYHWWLQSHDLGQQFQQSYQKSIQGPSSSPETRFRRYETLNIMDLDNLSPSIFSSSKYPLQLIRTKSNIDQVCFPETLDRMIIINAPVFFTFTWRMIRGFIDPRNANKVDLYGKSDWEKDKWRARLVELIDLECIPIQYRDPNSAPGLTLLPSTDVPDPEYSDVIRRASYFLNVRTDPSTPDLVLESGEILHVSVYTRSRFGGYVQIYHSASRSSSSKSSQLLHQLRVEHQGDGSMEEAPTCIQLTSDHLNGKSLDTPGIYTITVIPSGSKSDGSTSDDFVVAIRVCPLQKSSTIVMNGTTTKSKTAFSQQDLQLISPNLTNRVRSKDKVQLFRTPDDLCDLHDDSFEVQLSPDSSSNRQKKPRRWKSSRYLCGL